MKQVAGVYLLGGITLVSDIALPEIPPAPNGKPTPNPVTIRSGEASDWLPGAVELDADCFATASQYSLRIRGVARYLVTDGREIVVTPESGANALDLRAWLLGTIFVVLCQQRGLLPLHASAVSTEPVNGRKGVVAFLACSGQGKSSLAAHLAQRGFRVLADDVCLIDPTPSNELMVIPYAPWLKLWRNSLEHLGRPAEGLERVFSEDDKYRLPLETAWEPEPIRKVVLLEHGAAIQIEDVSPVEAIPLMMNLTHQAYVLQATGQRRENFLRWGRVLSQARAYRLIRPWGLEYLQATLDTVEKFLLKPDNSR